MHIHLCGLAIQTSCYNGFSIVGTRKPDSQIDWLGGFHHEADGTAAKRQTGHRRSTRDAQGPLVGLRGVNKNFGRRSVGFVEILLGILVGACVFPFFLFLGWLDCGLAPPPFCAADLEWIECDTGVSGIGMARHNDNGHDLVMI
jgi:hypothetical protein